MFLLLLPLWRTRGSSGSWNRLKHKKKYLAILKKKIWLLFQFLIQLRTFRRRTGREGARSRCWSTGCWIWPPQWVALVRPSPSASSPLSTRKRDKHLQVANI
jgi:hypothetical protein